VTTRTGPPARSTAASQPAPRWAGRPGTSRTGRDRCSSRPSCRTSSRAGQRNSPLRSKNRPSGGASPQVGAAIALGEIHRSGGATSTGTQPARPARAGRAAPTAPAPSRAVMCRAACRPDSAAMSAVSAACTRLPAANTPAADVSSVVSTAGPRMPGSIARPASRASS